MDTREAGRTVRVDAAILLTVRRRLPSTAALLLLAAISGCASVTCPYQVKAPIPDAFVSPDAKPRLEEAVDAALSPLGFKKEHFEFPERRVQPSGQLINERFEATDWRLARLGWSHLRDSADIHVRLDYVRNDIGLYDNQAHPGSPTKDALQTQAAIEDAVSAVSGSAFKLTPIKESGAACVWEWQVR